MHHQRIFGRLSLVLSAVFAGALLNAWIVRVPPESKPIIALCETVDYEDAHINHREAGHLWSLNDLVLDASIRYRSEALHDGAPKSSVAIFIGSLTSRRHDESIAQLCKEVGHPITTTNAVKDKTVYDVLNTIKRAFTLQREASIVCYPGQRHSFVLGPVGAACSHVAVSTA